MNSDQILFLLQVCFDTVCIHLADRKKSQQNDAGFCTKIAVWGNPKTTSTECKIWFCDDARGLSDKYVWMKLSK